MLQSIDVKAVELPIGLIYTLAPDRLCHVAEKPFKADKKAREADMRIFVATGSIDLTINEETTKFSAGEMFMVLAGTEYVVESTTGGVFNIELTSKG